MRNWGKMKTKKLGLYLVDLDGLHTDLRPMRRPGVVVAESRRDAARVLREKLGLCLLVDSSFGASYAAQYPARELLKLIGHRITPEDLASYDLGDASPKKLLAELAR